MIERTPLLNGLTQLALALAFVLMLLPIYMIFVASTHDFVMVNRLPMPLWPGASLIENYSAVLGDNGLGRGMANSLIMAVGVTVGKVLLAALSAYAIVYFRFRLRKLLFWMIFATLMLPLEVRIVPSY
ncbi:MAG: ABC transporter permease, partial [Bosea sp. (in: a-proteobacteria)]